MNATAASIAICFILASDNVPPSAALVQGLCRAFVENRLRVPKTLDITLIEIPGLKTVAPAPISDELGRILDCALANRPDQLFYTGAEPIGMEEVNRRARHMLKLYHPDKNPPNLDLSTCAFKYIVDARDQILHMIEDCGSVSRACEMGGHK
jgi:hypothetical protein